MPFPAPRRALTAIAIGREVEIPQKMKHIMVQVRPRRMVGFRPIRSDAQPQGTAVRLWDIEKIAPTMPAHFAMSFLPMPNPLIISGR